MTIDELKARLENLNDTAVAKVAGLDRGTVLKFRKGLHSPNVRTFEKMVAAVELLENAPRRGARAVTA